ncbi:MAG: hypothetical protein KC561_06465, partial [Myxococcales bacterium]|nr:hypothetical protein [Myxococcales bacterium]
ADFYQLYQVLQQLDREIDYLNVSGSSLGAFGEEQLAALEGDFGNRQVEMAVLIHDILQDLVTELDDWWFNAQEVRIEVGDVRAEQLQAILREGDSAISEGTTFVIVADDWQYWPWEGEYWLDEIDSYRGTLTTRCPDDGF